MMKNWQKVSIALAAAGGTLAFVVAPAFADVNLSAAGSMQSQDGTGAYGAVLDQNSNTQVGQVQADNYYNSTTMNGYTTKATTYTDNMGDSPTSVQTTQNYGGSSWTSANEYASQGASVTQNQTQNVDGGWYFFDGGGSGGVQSQASGAISGTLSSDSISGGVALSTQDQNGSGAYNATLGQSANVQAGSTSAYGYKSDSNSNGGSSDNQQYNTGALVSDTTNTNYGGSTYTSAHSLSNQTAGASQDSNQVVQSWGAGGTQDQAQGAAVGSMDGFWSGY